MSDVQKQVLSGAGILLLVVAGGLIYWSVSSLETEEYVEDPLEAIIRENMEGGGKMESTVANDNQSQAQILERFRRSAGTKDSAAAIVPTDLEGEGPLVFEDLFATARGQGNLSVEEFTKLLTDVHSKLPTQSQLQVYRMENTHSLPRPLQTAQRWFEDIIELTDGNSDLVVSAQKFYHNCLNDVQLDISIRAACYTLIVEREGVQVGQEILERAETGVFWP